MAIEIRIPGELVETYHGNRELTDDDLIEIADEVFRTTEQIMREDPRGWTSWEGFLGFTIGRACHYHLKMTGDQYRKLVDLCMVMLEQHKPQIQGKYDASI